MVLHHKRGQGGFSVCLIGWVRELVIRNPQNEDIANMDRKHTAADAYYYAPKDYGSVKLVSYCYVCVSAYNSFLNRVVYTRDGRYQNFDVDAISICKASVYQYITIFITV